MTTRRRPRPTDDPDTDEDVAVDPDAQAEEAERHIPEDPNATRSAVDTFVNQSHERRRQQLRREQLEARSTEVAQAELAAAVLTGNDDRWYDATTDGLIGDVFAIVPSRLRTETEQWFSETAVARDAWSLVSRARAAGCAPEWLCAALAAELGLLREGPDRVTWLREEGLGPDGRYTGHWLRFRPPTPVSQNYRLVVVCRGRPGRIEGFYVVPAESLAAAVQLVAEPRRSAVDQ